MTIKCKITSIEALASHTFRILLQPEISINYKAGQYLLVVMGEEDKRPFSIASSPCRHQGELELHIGAAEHNPYAFEVVEKMKQALEQNDVIEIDAPHGDAWIQESNQRSILLIAGGTGFSYVRSILDHCLSQQRDEPIYLYWGAKEPSQLYAMDELYKIAEQYPNLSFIPVVEQEESPWKGKIGNVIQAVEQDFDSLAEFDIYIAGRFEMADIARTRLTEKKQANPNRMYADAYAFL